MKNLFSINGNVCLISIVVFILRSLFVFGFVQCCNFSDRQSTSVFHSWRNLPTNIIYVLKYIFQVSKFAYLFDIFIWNFGMCTHSIQKFVKTKQTCAYLKFIFPDIHSWMPIILKNSVHCNAIFMNKKIDLHNFLAPLGKGFVVNFWHFSSLQHTHNGANSYAALTLVTRLTKLLVINI